MLRRSAGARTAPGSCCCSHTYSGYACQGLGLPVCPVCPFLLGQPMGYSCSEALLVMQVSCRQGIQIYECYILSLNNTFYNDTSPFMGTR